MDKELQEHLNNEFKQAVVELKKHAAIANEEMGSVKNDLGIVKNDVAWFKDKIEKFDARLEKFDAKVWWILGSVVLTALIQIIITLASNGK